MKFIKRSNLLRKLVAFTASLFNSFPQQKLNIIGITGSNGKTTTSYIVRHLLITQGLETGLIGTSGYWLNNSIRIEPPAIGTTPITTPDPFRLFKLLRQMVKHKTQFCVMEVSSAGLRDWRIFGINFKVAILTSLSRTYHVETHGTFNNYKNCKRRLFEILKNDAVAILPYDNQYFNEFKTHTRARVISYGLSPRADINGKIISESWGQTHLLINTPKGAFEVNSRFNGAYNCLNILSSVAVCLSLDFDIKIIKQGIETIPPIMGRFEMIGENMPFKIIVDKANTTEAFTQLIETVKRLQFNHLIIIYGNFHDYSLEVREAMAQITLNNSDLTIITTDDPKNENPEKGLSDFTNYAKRNRIDKNKYLAILDRREAIKEGIKRAKSNDLILILGRGDEQLMNIQGQIVEFDDRKIVKEILTSI